MGLDMYLTGDRFIWTDDAIRKKAQALEKCPYKVESIRYEIGYWRKANAIHKWFVDNVQDGNDDGGTYYVDKSQLEELLEKVKLALKSDNPGEFLPTQPGFFFGTYEYDDWYYSSLKDTKKIIEKFLNFKDKDKYDLYYHASW